MAISFLTEKTPELGNKSGSGSCKYLYLPFKCMYLHQFGFYSIRIDYIGFYSIGPKKRELRKNSSETLYI